MIIADATNEHVSRFLGFSVIVSNTTEKDDGMLCFKDNYFTLETIPNSINITCPIFARYVIFYNKRTDHLITAGYSDYAFNDLCELEVFGKIFREKENLSFFTVTLTQPFPLPPKKKFRLFLSLGNT